MPQYEVTDPDSGQTLQLEGDAPPSEAELSEIFARSRKPAQPVEPPPEASAPTTAPVPEQGNWLSRWADRQAPLKGMVSGAVKAAGGVLKAAETFGEFYQPDSEEYGGPRFQQQMDKAGDTLPARIERIQSGPAFQEGKRLEENAPKWAGFKGDEQKGLFTKAGEMAAEFVPLIVSGPFAPVTIGYQSFSEHLVNDYENAKKSGKSEEEAAQTAMDKALVSGGVQGAIFAVLPAPLRKLGDKYLVEKFGTSTLARFFAARAAQAGEGAALGATSRAAEGAVEGEPIGTIAKESAASAIALGAMQGATGAAGAVYNRLRTGRPDMTAAESEAFESGPESGVDPRAVAWAGTFGAAGPQADTANVKAPVRVVPGDYVPPEPGPLRPIPDVRNQPGRLRVQLQSTQPNEGDQNATAQREESQNDQLQYPGATQGAPVPENEPEVRQVAGEKPNDRNSIEAGAETSGQAELASGFGVSSDLGPGRKLMQSGVIPPLNHPEILDSVVSSVPVSVMNNLGGAEATAKTLFHDPAVLLDHLASAPDTDVTAFRNRLESDIAANRAKLSDEDATGGDRKLISALDTLEQNLRERPTRTPPDLRESGALDLRTSEANAAAGTESGGNGPVRPEAENASTKLAGSSQLTETVVQQTGRGNGKKAAATREAARQPDIIDWVEGNYPKGIKPSNVNEFGAYVDSTKGAARKLLFKTQGEDADKAAKEYTIYSGVETSEEDLLKQIADAGASRQDNEARRKREDEAAVQAGKFASAIKKGKFEITPEKLKIGDKVTVDYEPLTVKRIDARNGEVYLQGGDKFGQQVVRFGAKFRAQKFEERPARESRIAGDLFEAKPREPAAEKAEEAPATAPAAESGKDSPELSTPPPAEPDLFSSPVNPEGKTPETKSPEEKPKLTPSDNKEIAGFVKRDRAVRDAKEGAEPLTPVERKRYDELMAKAGQEELPIESVDKPKLEKPPEPGSITPEQAATIEAVQKYRVKGAGPQTWTMVEKLAQNEAEKEAGEQPVKVRNDKTGKEEVMLETDLEPVRTRSAEERAAGKGMSKKDLDEALLKAGMEPSEFPDAASKRAALKRFRAKGGKASLAEAFYSRITRAVEESKQGKATGAQWKATIRNSKSGISKDEWALVSVDDLQDGKAYAKQEVLDYLKANQVTVKDVTLGDANGAPETGLTDAQREVYSKAEAARRENRAISMQLGSEPYISGIPQTWYYKDADGFPTKVPEQFHEDLDRIAEAISARDDLDEELQARSEREGGDGGGTFFGQYTLPGAKEGSYREVLLTVPRREATMEEAKAWVEDKQRTEGSRVPWELWNDSQREKARHLAEIKRGPDLWKDGHDQYRDINNPIVRLRFNERTTADGKRMLFLEEVQPPQKGNFEKMPALFQKQWREIAFKWALRHAAENGFDSIGWTTGEQQAARYDLSKQVSEITVTPHSKPEGVDAYDVDVVSHNRGEESIANAIPFSELERYIGKDLASKVTASKEPQTFTGLDLKVGGEGLKKLYDQDFRNVVNSLAPVKKAGQKVVTTDISAVKLPYEVWFEEDGPDRLLAQYATKEEAHKHAIALGPGATVQYNASEAHRSPKEMGGLVHSLPITPEMKESVMLGQAQFHLDNEGQGGVRHEDAVSEIERARSKYPDAPPMQIVDRPDWVALGEDGNHYGIKGLWHSGRIWLNKAYLKNAEEARATLEHEVVHPLLETEAGIKVVEDAIASGLGKAKMDALIAKYGDRYVAQEEWFTKLAEEDRGLWKTIVDHVRQFLSKFGLVNLTDEEIGRGIIRMLREKQSKAVRSDTEPTAKDVTAFGAKANLTDEPVNPEDMNPEDFDREGPAAALAPRTNRHQVAGVKRLGSEYEVENMARIRDQVREQFFNGGAPLNPDNTEMAWNILQDLVDPTIRDSRAAMVRNQAGGQMAPGLLRNELWNYALRVAFTSKDPSLLRFMVERNADIATMGGSSDTAAGRALRAAQDRATGPLWASLVQLTEERARAARQELGVGEDLFNELVGTINSLDVPPEDLERMIIEGVDRTGRPVREVLEDLTPEAREAERILDQYERTQTEWLKPDRQLSIIRQIIRESIKGGPTAKYRDQAEFVNFVSERFQNATVPKDIADRLAYEVWKDKQARESAATSKALRAEETREQRNAESLLDRWAKEQTEWVKPERKNLVRDIIKEFMGRTVDKGNPERYRSELTQSIRGAGVPENIARELAFQAWNRKLTFDDARLARAKEAEIEKLAKAAENTAKAMLNRLESRYTEWVKPDQKPGVAKIIADALRPLNAAERKELGELAIRRDAPEQKARYDELKARDMLPEADAGSFVVPLRDRLIAAGVKEDTAYRLAREIYQKRNNDLSVANTRATERAANSGSIRSLIEAIRTSPYRSQMDPAWRIKTASDWFVSNGVERGRADVAAKLFNAQFEKAMGTATEREARRILRDEEPKRLQDVIAAIRAGLTDPDRNWIDDIAMRKGYKPLTKEQHARLAELEQKFSDPNLSTAERVATTEQIFGVLRHSGYVTGATWRFIAGSYANSLLSGTRTLALHIFQPAASMLLRDIPMHVVTNLHHPGDIVTVGRLLLQAAKSWFPQAKFAWQNDAYTFSAHEMTLRHNELKRQFEIAQGELKSKTASGIAKGTLRMLYAWQQYVTRALQTANQAGMAITRDIKLALYGSRAMRDFGLSTSEISQMVDVISDAKRAAYEDGLLSGLDKATAAVVADEKANKALSEFFSNATNDQTAKDILKAAENDAYSIVGRRAPGVNEIDEAFLSRPFVWLMEAATKARSRSGQESMLSIALLGFVNVPLRLARFHMNSGPYALLRWGVDKYRKATNRETFWKQSFANSLQARQRLNEALFGAGLMLAGGLLGATFHSSDEDASKKKFGVYFTGAGPKSKVLRDAWQKRGFRPYSIQVVVDGKMINFPLTRVGQVLAQPFVLASTLDDAEWARKEAAASGKTVPQKATEIAALGVGNYYHMVIGDMGFFQSVEQGIRLGRGEKNIGASVLDKITSVAAATVLPGKQLLSNISDWFMGPLDRSSVQSAIAANFPVLGAPWQKKAINRFGDELYDQTLYGKIVKSGLPFAVRVSDTPENEKLYGLMLNKGASAPDLRRYVVEEKYGPLSDEQWSKFAKLSGDTLKESVLSAADGLKGANPEEVKKFLVQAGTVANRTAAEEMGLSPQKQSETASRGGSGGQNSMPGIPGSATTGRSSGVSSPKITGNAGAGIGSGRRLGAGTSQGRLRTRSKAPKGVSGSRRLVHGRLSSRSGRIRRVGLPKSHHRRLSAA